MPWSEQIEEIARGRDAAHRQGGESAVVRQHARGRLTIRERVDGLLDPGSFRAGAAAVLAVATVTVPWASIIVRKSMGLGAAAHYASGAFILAWPSAETGALPVEGGVAIAFRKEIAAAADPAAWRAELEEAFAQRRSPFPRAEALAVHDMIDPRETRARLSDWIELSWPLLTHQLGPTAFSYRP